MAFSINSNNGFSSRSIGNAQKSQNEALQRLSSMLRINSAKDDAAGSAIFQRQTAAIRGTDQAIRNANDGISFSQIAQGGLSQVTSNLQRMRELAVQASNSIVGDRSAIQSEINQLSAENTRLGESTSFGGQSIFPSADKTITFQVGANADTNNQISVNLKSLQSLNSVSSDQGGNAIDVSSAASAQSAIEQIDADLEAVSKQASNFGAIENRFGAAISNAEEFSINMQESRSRIGDADVAKEVSKLIQAQIQEKAGIFSATQANQSKKMVLSLLGGG
ncbi:MAG: flagellin FliC [Methylococcaceae bacterium]|nr:flagellin FliC [Methylococcaceae bacterium]